MQNKLHYLKARVEKVALAFLFSTSLIGCSSLSSEKIVNLSANFSIPKEEILINIQDEVERVKEQYYLFELSTDLETKATTNAQKADIFYKLGVVNYQLGLYAQSKLMFLNCLRLKSDYGPAYNFLGIFYADEGNYVACYDAFDSAIELGDDQDFAFFNRSIALYYAGKKARALTDVKLITDFDNSDPYRSIWYFLIQRDLSGEASAITDLKIRNSFANKDGGEFGFAIISYLLGDISKTDLFRSAKDPNLTITEQNELLCEIYFYLGKNALYHGKKQEAYDYFRLCVLTSCYGFLEYRLALIEIKQLEEEFFATQDKKANKIINKEIEDINE